MFDLSIFKNSFKLAAFATLTIGMCVLTYMATKDRIALEKRKAVEAALLEVLPKNGSKGQFNNNLLDSVVQVKDPRLGQNKPTEAYLATLNEEPIAAVFQVAAPEGYGGTINLLVGIYFDGSLSGVRVVVPHPETPGLGDGIEAKKSDWILSFNGKSLRQPAPRGWAVTKDGGEFDAFTGATITPRAVVKSVFQTLQYFEENKYTLFDMDKNAKSNPVNSTMLVQEKQL